LKNKYLTFGSLWMSLAVMLGAFGAHGLKKLVSEELLKVFETGTRYHLYHGLGLLILGLISLHYPKKNFNLSFWAFNIGILLFSFNCYLYVLTGIKLFAMIIPIGGVSFIFGWLVLFYTSIRPEP
jgi:uncharacterized membrane protein YgdD (TMEM256/DUF423 family)